MEYAVDPNGNNAPLYTHLRIQEQRGQLDAEGAEILETLRADYQELEPIEVPPAETPVARTVEVPARDLVVGLVVDDERFPHVVPVGYAKVGRKWVTFRAFHPDAPVYPNPPRRVPVNGTVRVETRGTVTVLVESDYDDDVHFERTVVLPGPVSNDEEAVETWFDEVVLEETGDGHHQHTCGYCYTGTVVSEGPLKGETREWSGR